MPDRETKLMKQVRDRYGGRPLRDIIREEYQKLGLPKMSEELGVSRGTLWYWIVKEGFKIERTLVDR